MLNSVSGKTYVDMGDVTLLAAAGLYLRPEQWLLFLSVAGVCGILCRLVRNGDGRKAFDPGLVMITALFACLLVPGLDGIELDGLEMPVSL